MNRKMPPSVPLAQLPILQVQHAIANGREGLIVRHNNEGLPVGTTEPANGVVQECSIGRVQIACRLVGKDEPWRIHKGTRYGHALLLSPAKSPGPVGCPIPQTQLVQELFCLGYGLCHAVTTNERRHGDVFQRRELREEVMKLEDESYGLVPKTRKRPVIRFKNILPLIAHLPGIRAVQRSKDVKQRTLARAAGTNDAYHLSPLNGQRSPFEYLQTAPATRWIPLDDALGG